MTGDRRPIFDVEAVLAIGSLMLFGGALGVILFALVPEKNEKYVMLMLGALIGVVKDTFGRYFQATKGAQEQRQDAAEVAKTLAETAAVAAAAPAATSAAPEAVTLAPGDHVDVAAETAKP
jgi:hypothetical protein